MGAHSDNVNSPASVEDYLSAGDLITVLQTLTFDESAAYVVTIPDTPGSATLLIARIGRTSIKMMRGDDILGDVAIHVHDSIEGAIECHQGTIQAAIDLAGLTGHSLMPV